MHSRKASSARKVRKKKKSISSRSFLEIDTKSNDNVHRSEALRHSRIYTQLLLIYKGSIKCSVILKSIFKAIFFLGTMTAFGFVVYFFCISLKQVSLLLVTLSSNKNLDWESVLGMVTVIIPAAGSLIAAFIEIPKIIAQYLFDTKEDSYVDSVIKNIQTYDTAVFKLEGEVKELLSVTKSDNSGAGSDEHIETVPDAPDTPDESNDSETSDDSGTSGNSGETA